MNTQALKKFKVLLIGDVGIDEYQYGTVDRLSPEAPVPIFKLSHKIVKPGMAANVESNLQALDLSVTLLGSEKSIKTRLIDFRSMQHIVRIDKDIILDQSLTIDDITYDFSKFDAIVFSDYEKGLISYELVEDVRNKYRGPIFIDTKKTDLIRFNGCYVKVNESEYKNSKSINDQLIVTLGRDGAVFKQNNVEILHDSVDTEVVDVCGAGDTFLAALVYSYLNTYDIHEAIRFANIAASITVKHMGVYAPTLEEINEIARIR
jgi:bifunctional ADP-heptose synthase (sugar kinase/adenylyltransferase)